MPSRRAIAALLVLAFMTGCGSSRPSGPQVGPQVGSQGIAREVEVQNGTGMDLRISVMHGSALSPVGTVRAMENRSVRLPSGATGVFRLVAEPVGGGMASRLFSETIDMARGQSVTWQLRATGGAYIVYGRGS